MHGNLISKYLEQNKLLCVLGLLLCAYFSIQPWNRITADGIWMLIGLISLSFIVYRKTKGHSFETPIELKRLYWIFIAIPLISIISFIATPFDNLPTSYLEPDIRWLLAIPMIITFREIGLTIKWGILALLCYALSSFVTVSIDTNLFSNLNLRVDGDENAVPFGMFSASISFLVLMIFTSDWLKHSFISPTLLILTKSVLLLFLFMLIITTYLSGTRAAFMLIPLAIIITFAISYNVKKAIMGIVVLLIAIILAVYANKDSTLIKRLVLVPERISHYFENYDKLSRLRNQRLEQWKEATCIFQKHPILGTGPRSFREAHQAYGGEDHCDAIQVLPQGSYQAHSVYFETLFSKGLLGTCVFLALLLNLISIIKKHWHAENPAIKLACSLLLAAVISHLVNGLTLDLWFRNHVMGKNLIILILPLSLLFAKSSPPRTLDNPL